MVACAQVFNAQDILFPTKILGKVHIPDWKSVIQLTVGVAKPNAQVAH